MYLWQKKGDQWKRKQVSDKKSTRMGKAESSG
jgi:hypothetical protein